MAITGGELLLQALRAEGVEVMFGVLDGSFNTFLAKLDEYGIRYICPRHEAAAAHMAEAWTRVRGTPAVCVGGIGPGAANMVSGLATAYAEGVPVIAISGQRRRNIIYPDRGGSFQNIPLVDLYRPVTKWAAGVRDWQRLPELLRQAFRVALSGRPGPVFLEVPEDILRGTGEPETAPVWPAEAYRVTTPPAPDPALIAQAADWLAQAERPLLHAGAGVLWAQAWEEFRALGEHLGAAFTTSLAARGVVPEDHPRYFHLLNRDALEAARREADVILVVGGRLGELDGWGRAPLWGDPATQKTIQIDVDPTSIGLHRPVDLAILADARAALSALLAAVRERTAPKAPGPHFDRYRQMTLAWQAQLAQVLEQGTVGVNPGVMVKTVREAFPRDAIAVMDGGCTSLWFASYNPIYLPRTYLYTSKFGHLGTGLPYAIGAKIAAPDREVYLITGDGAFGFNIQELETARRHNVKITVILADDQGWGMERASQLFAQIGGMVETEHYAGTRYDQIAQAFGWYAEVVDDEADLLPALERARAAEGPALLQVNVDQTANLAPPGILEFTSMVYRAEG